MSIYRKAFYTVKYNILVHKLQELGASRKKIALSEIFKVLLISLKSKSVFEDCLSETRTLSTGIPQGSILGPLFFIVFIDNMSKAISHGKISMYANDTTLSVIGNTVKEIFAQLTSDLHGIMYWLKIIFLYNR